MRSCTGRTRTGGQPRETARAKGRVAQAKAAHTPLAAHGRIQVPVVTRDDRQQQLSRGQLAGVAETFKRVFGRQVGGLEAVQQSRPVVGTQRENA